MAGKRTPEPPKPRASTDGAAKEEVIRFRCTHEQKQVLIEAAAREDLDVSSWLRRLALKAAREAADRDATAHPPGKPHR